MDKVFQPPTEDREKNRDRWQSNMTFIIASVGCAIGLGNLWRFPYLCFKHGGAGFLVPYLICLFLLGIPMLCLEFGIGQILQRGNIEVWRMLHPRLYGLGLATCIACFLVVVYYNVIISWALAMFFNSFYSPLPWSIEHAKVRSDCPTGDDAIAGCGEQATYLTCPEIFITQEFFYKDMLGLVNDDCTTYNQSDQMAQGTFFAWQIWLSAMLTWAICFFTTFQGVKVSGIVVWITVPLPIVLVFLMVMNGFTLKNSDYGFRMYLKGYVKDKPIDFGEKLAGASIWSDAAGQIFFTLSICWGVMVSYASYIPKNSPVIRNAVAVAAINCSFSFFAGFSVFSVVGYLVGLSSPVSDKLSSRGLAFVAFPAAINTMPAPNFWCLLLFLTLFALGIDSAFAMVEGTIVVVQDSWIGKKWSKVGIATALCVIGAAATTLFCFNWSEALFDAFDHYLNIYTILSMGTMQAVAVGWYHCQDDAQAKHKNSAMVLIVGYFAILSFIPWVQAYGFEADDGYIMIIIWWAWFIILSIVSGVAATASGEKITWTEWYDEVYFAGVAPVWAHFVARSEGRWHWLAERILQFWWCVSIKFVFPWAIYLMLILTLKADIDEPYGGYHAGWQWLGVIIPVGTILLFLWYLIMNKDAPTGEFKKAFTKEMLAHAHEGDEVSPAIPAESNKIAPTTELAAQ